MKCAALALELQGSFLWDSCTHFICHFHSFLLMSYNFRLLPASIEALSPSKDVIRLPKVIAPFDAAVVVTKALQTNVIVQYTLSTLNQRLKGGILLDDR